MNFILGRFWKFMNTRRLGEFITVDTGIPNAVDQKGGFHEMRRLVNLELETEFY